LVYVPFRPDPDEPCIKAKESPMITRLTTSLIDHLMIRRPRHVTPPRRRARLGPEALEGRLLLAAKVGADPGPLPVPPVVVVGSPLSPPSGSGQQGLGPNIDDILKLYNEIKHFENDTTDYPLALPGPYGTVDVGTLDDANGQFHGLISKPADYTHEVGGRPVP